MIPLFLDLADRRVLIVGGGAVAARKARAFATEAEVTVISRSFHRSMPGAVRHVTADLEAMSDDALAALCEGAFLVIAATSDPGLNNRVVRVGASVGALTNNASGLPGDVHLPAVSRGEHFVIAVATGGESPGIARFLRERIDRWLPRLDRMIELQARLRRELHTRPGDQEARSSLLSRVLEDDEVWTALGGGSEEAWRLVEARYLRA